MPTTAALTAVLCAMLLVAGCASSGFGTGASRDKPDRGGKFGVKSLKTGNFSADGRYNLSPEERAQNCKRIRGKMGVRIVQLQRTGIMRDSSTLSKKFGGFFGGDSRGLSPAQRRKRDRAKLVSYNQLLGEKNCPTVDLEKELAKSLGNSGSSGAGTPAAQRPVQNKAPKPQTR